MEKVTVKIEGMRCSMCEAHVNDLFRRHLNLKKVKSSSRKGVALIIGEGPYTRNDIEKAIEGSGYSVLEVTIESK